MQTKKYQVECVDRDTGEKSLHVFEGVSEKAASDLANRMGFLVGGVTALESQSSQATQTAPKPPRPPRRWVWFIFGTIFGVALSVVAVAILIFFARVEHQQRLAAIGLDPEADRRWADEWPKLTFPARPESGSPVGVKVAYDEFRNYTSFETEIQLSYIRLWMSTTETGRVAFPKQPPARVSFMVSGAEARGERELILLVDGVRIILSGKVEGLFDLETRDLLRMANAKEVRGRFGPHEFSMSADGFARLRGFASMLKK